MARRCFFRSCVPCSTVDVHGPGTPVVGEGGRDIDVGKDGSTLVWDAGTNAREEDGRRRMRASSVFAAIGTWRKAGQPRGRSLRGVLLGGGCCLVAGLAVTALGVWLY